MKHLASLLIIIICLASCKKYEEGPSFSLRSKKERVANTWVLEEVTAAGIDITNNFPDYVLVMEKSGLYSWAYEDAAGTISDNGTWRFNSDNTQIEMLSNVQGSTVEAMTILRLKEKSLWFSTEDAGVQTTYHLKPQ